MGRQIARRKVKVFCQINIVSLQLQFKAVLGECKFSQQCKITLPVSADCKENYWKGLEWSWNLAFKSHSFTGLPVPVSYHPLSREFLPNTESKPILFHFKTILPCPVTTCSSKQSLSIFIVGSLQELALQHQGMTVHCHQELQARICRPLQASSQGMSSQENANKPPTQRPSEL